MIPLLSRCIPIALLFGWLPLMIVHIITDGPFPLYIVLSIASGMAAVTYTRRIP